MSENPIRINIPIHFIARRLREGWVMWGGGASVRRQLNKGGLTVYLLQHVNEDGSAFNCEYITPTEALWRYLERLNGDVLLNWQEPEYRCAKCHTVNPKPQHICGKCGHAIMEPVIYEKHYPPKIPDGD